MLLKHITSVKLQRGGAGADKSFWMFLDGNAINCDIIRCIPFRRFQCGFPSKSGFPFPRNGVTKLSVNHWMEVLPVLFEGP